MKRIKLLSMFAAGVAALLAVASLPSSVVSPAEAATTVPPIGTPGVQVIPLQISKQYTADTTAVVKLKMPFAVQVLGVSATARASGGTNPTLTVNVKAAGTTILSAPISITAGTVSEGTITTASIADEATVTVDLVITGTNPTWDDITVLLTVARAK